MDTLLPSDQDLYYWLEEVTVLHEDTWSPEEIAVIIQALRHSVIDIWMKAVLIVSGWQKVYVVQDVLPVFADLAMSVKQYLTPYLAQCMYYEPYEKLIEELKQQLKEVNRIDSELGTQWQKLVEEITG